MKKGRLLLPLLISAIAFSMLCSCGKAPVKAAPKQEAEAPVPAVTPPPKKPKVEDREEGSLNTKIQLAPSELKEEVAKVEDDASNVVVDDSGSSEEKDDDGGKGPGKASVSNVSRKDGGDAVSASPLPTGSLASHLAELGKDYSWQPKWRFKGIGGPWMQDMAQSPDGSVLAFVEMTGQDDGPYGSRLVLWSVHQWKVLKVLEIPDKKIEKAAFVPGSQLIACLCGKQAEAKQPYCLALLDLANGNVVSFSAAMKMPGASICCGKDGSIFVSGAESKSIFIFESKKMDAAPAQVQSLNNAPALAISEDGHAFAAAGDAQLELFSVAGSSLRPVMSCPLPEDFKASTIRFAGSSDSLLLASSGACAPSFAYCLQGKTFKKLLENASGIIDCDPAGKTIYAGLKLRSQIVPFSLPSLIEGTPVQASDNRPHTSGDPVFALYLPAASALGVLDSQGSFYLLSKKADARRWNKRVIFSAMK